MLRSALIIASGLAALAACYALWLAPALSAERASIISTPGLAGLETRAIVAVRANEQACTGPIYLTPDGNRIQYLLEGAKANADGIEMTVKGAELSGKRTSASVQPAGADAFLTLSFSPTARRVGEAATICIRPTKEPLSLVGTSEPRSAVTASTSVNGKPADADISLVLLGPANQTTGEVLREIPERVSATTLGLVPTWLVWAIAIGTILAAALLPLAALAWADRLDKPD